jgi:hypothetical protein
MRMLFAAAACVALNAGAQSINLDRPGALAALEKERPDHYRTVLMTVHATERMNCAIDLRAYQAGDMKRACRSHLIRTSYPAQVFLAIPVDKMVYTITAYLDHSQDRIAPAK